MKFYEHRSVEEQANRLPLELRAKYRETQLDRIKIDGEEILGYFEYSFMEEKSYKVQPTRADDGSMKDIDSIGTFLTPRIIIRYNMMNIDDYRKLMKKLKSSKNSFDVECYDIVEDKRVTHNMYFAPPSMPIIYQKYLAALGVQDFTIELIGTNNLLNNAVQIRHWYNLPDDYKNMFNDIGEYTDRIVKYNERVLVGRINIPQWEELNELVSRYNLIGWSTNEDGSGSMFKDGTDYYFPHSTELFAQWEDK